MKGADDKELSLGEQLMQAIEYNKLNTVQELLAQDRKLVNHTDQEGNTPLHIAAFSSRNEIAKALVENKANLTIKNKYGFVPGLIPLGNQLITAIGSDDIKTAKELLESHPELINFRDSSNSTPLHAACIKLDFNTVKFLLDKGADINAQDNNGKSPLHESAFFRVAVNEYAIIEGKDSFTRTPEQIKKIDQDYQERLKQARESGPKTIELLIKRGADINAITSQGDTALHIAAQSAYPTEKIATMLIEAGVDIDKQNDSKETASDIARKEEKKNNLVEAIKIGAERHAAQKELDKVAKTKVLSFIESNTITEILTKDSHTNLNKFVDALRKDPNKAAKDLLEGKVEKRTSAIIAKLLTGRKTDYDLAKEAIEQIRTSIRNPDAPLTKISRWSKNTQVTR